MASEESNHRRNQSTPQSIPLRDLNRPPDEEEERSGRLQHRRTLSDRGRALLSNRNSIIARTSRYAPIAEESPTRARTHSPPLPTIRTISSNNDGQPSQEDFEDVGISPVVDRANFQAAIGFAGLSFQGETSFSESSLTPTPGSHRVSRASLPRLNTRTPSLSTITPDDLDEGGTSYFPETENDSTPLTDRRHLQPISGTEPVTPSGQRHDRLSSQSVRFLTPDPNPSRTPSSARLGDDLANMEAGLRSSHDGALRRSGSRKRSLSPSAAASPIQRAGTMMRKMSQRVVNLSNESEVIDRTTRRRSSVRQSHLESPLPPLTPRPEFGQDGSASLKSSSPEKAPPPAEEQAEEEEPDLPKPPVGPWVTNANPLKGKSLGIFPPDSKLRTTLCDVLVHPVTEPCILILIVIQTILLAIDSAPDVFKDPRSKRWGSSWIDYGLLGLFCIYTVEIAARIIVSGFFWNPIEYSTINRRVGVRKALIEKAQALFSLQRRSSLKNVGTTFGPQQASIIRTFTTHQFQLDPAGDSRHQQRVRLAYRAFLRHSFNRLDFVAVVSFWISFVLGLSGTESAHHAYVFRMLSCLRILRLLLLTAGTSIILQSLKKAAPTLLNVAFLIGFFWLLFAIIGVQSFKSSLRRYCVWQDPDGIQSDFINNATGSYQFCGGYLGQDNLPKPWEYTDGQPGAISPKGFFCPVNSKCIELGSPYNGTVSYDNILQSLELVFVIMSSNTWSDLMYYLADTDYLISALFFAAGIVIMSFWLINLLIAVITSSFQVIREENKTSAFTAAEPEPLLDPDEGLQPRRKNTLKRAYEKTQWFWIAVITYGLIIQCLRSANMSPSRQKFIDTTETIVTFALLAEIIVRLAIDRRSFFRSKRNLFDLFLAVVTSVIQLPPVHRSGQPYNWLTIFQILRIYRVVLAVPLTRDLIMVVFGNFSGLFNLILFVFLLTFLAAIFAAQIFRGEVPEFDSNEENIRVTFATIYNSFLGMYTILSSENWTEIMYNVTNFDVIFNTAWIGSAFFILWFILANFIVLNMFIAVIQENFDVSEDEKRLQQVKAFLQQKELGGSSHGNLSLSTIFKLGRVTGRHRDPLDFGSHATEMLLKDAVVRDFLDEQSEQLDPLMSESTPLPHSVTDRPVVEGGMLSSIWTRVKGVFSEKEPNPFYSRMNFSRAYEDIDPRQMAREVFTAHEKRKLAQRQYLQKHPNYNVSLFIFRPDNPIRKICQRIVGPGRGSDRIDGVAPSIPLWYAFSAFIYAAIVAMVLLACVTTPLYQKTYFNDNDFSVKNWFLFTDIGFAILFTVEAIIKVIADGFFWTPNAYYRGSWGFIDSIVLITLWINIATALYKEGAVSRAVGAFKALRALRLLNVSDSARDTFHSVIVLGGWKVVSAAFVSLSLLIPFAIYGLNLFNGKMQSCNDGGYAIANLTDCVGEYLSMPYAWDVLAPRQVSNPYFDFDNFGSSLFILFQIVSQEGWTDVMWQAESITGVFTQPQAFAAQGNAVFFVVFNLLGAVFVLTLFVSVFMRNYTEQTGVAFLTTEQRSWLELRKLLRQVSPSKRPSLHKKRETWEEWCYKRAVKKNGRWQRAVTFVLILHLVLLCLEFYPSRYWWDRTRDYIFLAFTLFYIANIFIRLIGLTRTRFFRSSWDVYSCFAVTGTFITTVLLLSNFEQRIYVQLHKLFLVSIALLLIPRNNQLDQLFKTAAASLSAIGNLMATWFVLFLVYAIALTQAFGLTRFGGNGGGNINFRTVPKALILLFRISIGEGWNQVMEDYASATAPNCVVGERFFDGDCGSPEWARALFISWNILSMYIFVNLFVSLIYESFSYVYQRSSGLSVISRDEIRRFKQAWAEFDPDGTGFISKEQFPRLLGELSGVFEMRIYDGDFTVSRLIEDCKKSRRQSALPIEDRDHPEPVEIDVKKLNERLAQLPVEEIRRRRARMNIFYEEVIVSADPDRGIGFNALLMILAHYKVINENRSLRLEEFLRRRARLQRVEEAVRRNVVVGFFDTIYWSRGFRRAMERKQSGRMTMIPQLNIPEIYVDDEDDMTAHPDRQTGHGFTDPFSISPVAGPSELSPWDTLDDVASPRASASGSDYRGAAAGPTEGASEHLRNRSNSFNSIQITPVTSPTRDRISFGAAGHRSPSISPANSPQVGPHHRSTRSDVSDLNLFAGGEPGRLGSRPPSPLGDGQGGHGMDGARSRANSSVSTTAREVLDVLDNSAWGESIRRSFTMRRSQSGVGGRGSGGR